MEQNNQSCQISRWQLLKAQLNNLCPEEFKSAIMGMPEATLIDVRTPKEFAQDHLEGAINIDFLGAAFWEQLEQLDPAQTYFVYCKSGRRSTRVCTYLKNGGFSNVYNLEGGVLAWEEIFTTNA